VGRDRRQRRDLYNATPTPPAADIETLREYYADQYYGFLYQTVKDHRPESPVLSASGSSPAGG
jgi:hypothetical protein